MYFLGPLEFPGIKLWWLGELLAFLLHGGLNLAPIYQLRGVAGSCQWLLTDWSFLTHRSSGSSPLQPTTWSCTRIGCCQGNRETSFWVTGCQIASALSSSRAIPSSFPPVSRTGTVDHLLWPLFFLKSKNWCITAHNDYDAGVGRNISVLSCCYGVGAEFCVFLKAVIFH